MYFSSLSIHTYTMSSASAKKSSNSSFSLSTLASRSSAVRSILEACADLDFVQNGGSALMEDLGDAARAARNFILGPGEEEPVDKEMVVVEKVDELEDYVLVETTGTGAAREMSRVSFKRGVKKNGIRN